MKKDVDGVAKPRHDVKDRGAQLRFGCSDERFPFHSMRLLC
jgi:hypothetical protein